MTTLLITGSNGFIGRYFIDKYSNFYNIKTFSFLNDDLNKLNLQEINVILHLSALVHQMAGAGQNEYNRVNVTQTLELAQKAKESAVEHFIFISSVKVYGEEIKTTYREDTDCDPKDEYGKSKLKAEQELLKLEDDDFKISIIRTPIVYGYGVKANIKNLVNLVKKTPILPFVNINNRRSMVYIGNLCYLLDITIIEQAGGIFLACDDKIFSTTQLIQMIANQLNKNIYLVKIPFFRSVLKQLKPEIYKRLYKSLEIDNSNTVDRLGLKNPYTIEDGIKFMIKGEDK